MAHQPMSEDESGARGFARLMATIVTAQNSCPVHEQCASGCPNRIGARRYRLMPDGERRDEVDLRAQLAATHLDDGPPRRTEPLTIGSDVPEFAYSPLARPGRMIRLLRLKRAIFRADPVECDMAHFDIDSAPAYGALSNLERALKRLRAGFAPGEREEYVWADALCINQQDAAEKDCQIRLMERIYSSAATVYVDLGDVAGQEISAGGVTLRFGDLIGGMGTPDALTRELGGAHPLNFHTVVQALTQPWFTRTWIIQEAALARAAKYMFGGTVFTQEQLDGFLSRDALRADPERIRVLTSHPVAGRNFLNYSKLQQIKKHRGEMEPLQLLRLTRDFAATHPEDKIFGLFALMSDADRDAIGPYTRSAEQVFRRFAALQVRRGRVAPMLDSAGLQRRRLQARIPSWVPDWTAQGTSPAMLSTLRPVPYSASGSAPPSARLVGDDTGAGGLSVRCVVVDAIATVEHVHSAPRVSPGGPPDFLVFHDRFRAAFDELVRQGRSIYRDNEEAFARLLLADDTYTGGNAILYSSPIVDPAATYRSALAAFRQGCGYRGTMAGQKMNAVETYQMQASTTVLGRGFATTRTGYIGLVSPMAQIGDLVVVIMGATVPYVVRKAEGGYLLVGDAFVHGLMYGEALGRPDLQPVDIVLV
ncbi:hypothetical protein VTH06DRAFT_4559 [Thermothelomyces fergusii]